MKNEYSENDRLNLFYNKDSFNLDIEYSLHYIETDLNMEFTLYRVNYRKTKSNNIYGETKAKDKTFLEGVKLHGIINIAPSENSNYGDSGIRREDVGEIMIGVYKRELEKNDVTINAGDFIMYRPDGEKMRYFEIKNPNYVDYSTSQTRMGIKSVYKRMIAVPVREDVILKFND